MQRRIRCLWHAEATPSLVQRREGWRCYGECQKLYTNEEVAARTGEDLEYVEPEDEEKEDLEETYRYINSLPRQRIRGLDLPADRRGFYIPWPDGSYFKYRLFDPGQRGKYLSPRGHRPTLFWANKRQGATLALCEGELNALSVAKAYPEWAVGSPGSATNFNADFLAQYLPILRCYASIIVILDDDSSGIKALIRSKAFLLYKIPFVSYIKMQVDCNDVLQERGPEGLRAELQGADRR